MATTPRQDQDFLNDVVGSSLLESAIDWIKGNLYPEQVFDGKQLRQWASDSGVEEVFSEKELTEWANENDFIKSE